MTGVAVLPEDPGCVRFGDEQRAQTSNGIAGEATRWPRYAYRTDERPGDDDRYRDAAPTVERLFVVDGEAARSAASSRRPRSSSGPFAAFAVPPT